VSDLSDAFLIRARESLLGADSEFVNGRYSNVANRAYYACFQSAIAALVLADIRPPGRQDEWGHEFVQSQFEGVLIGRRKQYSSDLRSIIPELRSLRHQGDYRRRSVTRSQASRALNRATQFVMAVERAGEPR
jgi:uncharacterized protein (UPF0332 family)